MELIIFIMLFALGYFAGGYNEKRHYASIIEREKKLVHIPTTNARQPLTQLSDNVDARLVHGSVVVSVDYFKRILAGLRAIFGGNVRAYETLVDRGRREAVLRLKESCPGAAEIVNLRIETSSISKGKKNQVGSVEVLAYGTAIFNR